MCPAHTKRMHRQRISKQAPVTPTNAESLESWIWGAACSIPRSTPSAKDAPKYNDYILPLIFTKRLCDVFDDHLSIMRQ